VSLARATLALFVVGVIAAHVAHPELTPMRHMVSEYANQPRGWLITVGFASWAASLGLTALACRWARMQGAFMVAAAGAVLVCLFKTQAVAGEIPRGVEQSPMGHAHDVGGALLLAGLALVGVLLALPSSRAPQRLRQTATALFVIATGLTAGFLAAGDPWPGLRQRMLIAIGVGLQSVLLGAAAAAPPNLAGTSLRAHRGESCIGNLER
jgi:hypothetical protein